MGQCAFLCLWINIFVLEKILSGYLPVCVHPWRDSAGEARPLPKGLSWAGGTAGGGFKKLMEARLQGRENPFMQHLKEKEMLKVVGLPWMWAEHQLYQVVPTCQQQELGQLIGMRWNMGCLQKWHLQEIGNYSPPIMINIKGSS